MAIYVTLADLKQYGDVKTTSEDVVLSQALDRAEAWFERVAGSRFVGPVGLTEPALRGWVNLHDITILVRSVAPVTAVGQVVIRDRRTQTKYTLDSSNATFVLPVVLNPVLAPDPSWWRIRISDVVGSRPNPASAEDLDITVTYTGGLSTVPDSLKSLICRLAWWIYKLRSAPLGRVATMELGIMEIPLTMPRDLETDLMIWRRPVF
jgi:hypothetical protein